MAISSPGIGSNLDVNGIVSKLMQVESQPLTALNTRETSFQTKLTAFGSLKGALSTFQTAVHALNDPTVFQSLKATSSDATVATALSSSTAVAGSYALNVSKVAQSQNLVAAGQADATAAIGTGATTTLTFDFGTISGGAFAAYVPATGTGGTYSGGATFVSNGNGAKTVTIDSSNNSLTGIRDAINAAKIGVTASIVNDGGSSPYRLVLSSDNMGKNNSLKVSVSGDATLSGLLSQDPGGTQSLQETVTGQNTEMTVNGVFVSKSSSALSDVIQGVTLTALKTGTSSISVAQDTSGTTATAVGGFVKAYNDLSKTLKTMSAYDASTNTAAVLQGDATLRGIQSQIRGVLNHALQGGGTYANLSQIGITQQLDGTLALDTTKLQSALASNPYDVAAVFSATGKGSDSLVNFVSSTANTKAGAYALTVSQLATQGNLIGSAAAGLTITAGANDTLSVTAGGVSATVTLTAKTYASADELALEVQSKINGSTPFSSAGISLAVSQSAGVLSITSNRYGSGTAVAVSGTGADNLLGSGRTSNDGLNVAGTINGVAGTGYGQNLIGANGNDAEGLKVQIAGGVTGNRGIVNFSQGYAYQLDNMVTDLLGTTGSIANMTDSINQSIKDIGNRRDALNIQLTNIEARYRKQYAALDALIGTMNSTSSFLTQQLATLNTKTG